MIIGFSLLTLIIVIARTESQATNCTTGCLKCDRPSNKCLYCDNANLFIVENSQCIAVDYKGCVSYSVNGRCLQCQPNMYLDPKNNICIDVPKDSQIPNCIANSAPDKCSLCAKDYYLVENQCLLVPKLIDGCELYKPGFSEICLACNKDYTISRDQKICIKKEDPATCLYYKNVQCKKCKEGYYQDKNYYLNSILALNSTDSREILRNWILGKATTGFSDCRKTNITNCEVFNDFKSCKTCKVGYILSEDNNCTPFPVEQIPNCVRYKSFSVCIECKPGMFLGNNGCTPVMPIVNCDQYNTTANTTECVLCKLDYYLSEKACVLRTNKFNNQCAVFKTNADACEKCDESRSLQVTDDGLKCLDRIPSCLVYEVSNTFATSLACKTCIENYTFNSDKRICEKGTISNCKTYTKGNVCSECYPMYYISNQGCILQPFIDNCAVYSPSAPKTCAKCKPGFFLFTRSNQCLIFNPILNCQTYASPVACSVCFEGYERVDNGAKCQQIAPTKNCLVIESSKCVKCKQDYLLDGGVCTQPTDYFNENCAANNIDGLISSAQYQCWYCKPGSIPTSIKNLYMCTATTSLAVANCLKFSKDNTGKFKCDYCKDGYYVDDGACVTSCTNSKLPHLATFSNSVSSGIQTFVSTGVNQCVAIANTLNCVAVAPTSIRSNFNAIGSTAPEYSCVLCATDFVPVVGTADANNQVFVVASSVPYNTTKFDMASALDVYPKFDCTDKSRIFGEVNSTGFVTNCEYYHYLETGSTARIGCIKCLHGYSGESVAATFGLGIGYIKSCALITDCDATVVYKGLSNSVEHITHTKIPMELYYSCHKCTGTNKFPVTFISFAQSGFTETNFSGVTKFIPYPVPYRIPTATKTTVFTTNPNNRPMTQCLTMTDSTFSNEAFGLTFPTNCALFMVNSNGYPATNQFKLDSASKFNLLSIYCTACSPGFKISGSYTTYKLPFMIFDCVAIANCASGGTWVNFCSQCQTGYVYEYSVAARTILFDSCVAFTADSFCYAAEAGKQTCTVCQRGYFLNEDNRCHKVSVPYCAKEVNLVAQRSFNYAIAADYKNLYYGRMLNYFFSEGVGCNECVNSTYASFQVTDDSYVCMESSYIKAGALVTDSKFPSNCDQFSIDNSKNFVCKICKTGYMVSTSGLCYLNSANGLKNCKTAINAENCDTCLDGFIFLNKVCITGTINNCKDYLNSRDAVLLFCSRCNDGYYAVNGVSCLRGNIPNCKVYDSEKTCNTCNEGFKVARIKDGQTYCFKIPEELKCKSFNPDFQAVTMTCDKCNDGYVDTKEGNFPLSYCIAFDQIPNCYEYDSQSVLTTSTLKCKKCRLNYYLSTATAECISRTKIDKQCNYIHISQDKCLRCRSGYFLSDNFLDCIPFPSGIIGCQVYETMATCKLCKEGLYLQTNTTCFQVPTNETIPFCKYYNNLKKCIECGNGYYLDDGSCTPSMAKNCFKWKNSTACESCPAGMGFRKEDDNYNCANFTDANCLIPSNIFPFPCQKCKLQFYPDETGACKYATKIIDNCLYYLAIDKCMTCSPGYVLSIDKTLCTIDDLLLAQVDANCEDNQLVSPSVCTVCQLGYYFGRNGNCTKCNVTAWESVATCNPENPQEITMCSAGYYMNLTEGCSKNPVKNVTDSGISNGSNTNPRPNSSRLLQGLVSYLTFALIFTN